MNSRIIIRLHVSVLIALMCLLLISTASSQRDEDKTLRPIAQEDEAANARSSAEEPMVQANRDPSTNIVVRLKVDKPFAKPGDTVTLSAAADRDCHLTILSVSPSGEGIRLWPNRSSGWKSRVSAGLSIQVPSPGDSFQIQIDGTRPRERIVALATDRPGALFNDGDFRAIRDTGLSTYAGRTRDFMEEVQARIYRIPENAKWGTAQVIVRVSSEGEGPDDSEMENVIVEMRVRRGYTSKEVLSKAAGVTVPTFRLDSEYDPVPLRTRDTHVARSLEESNEEVIVVRGQVHRGRKSELQSQPGVIKVWRDTPIATFQARRCPIEPCDCAMKSTGPIDEVARYLGVDKVWEAGFKGKGIVIGIVDTGIAAKGRYNGPKPATPGVVGGWPSNWGAIGGGHGNMTATDVLGMAPEAELYDMRVIDRPAKQAVSAAITAYEWAIKQHKQTGKPHILSNSWGIFQEAWDPEYARKADHPFTRKLVEAMDQGILVVFSAGNCGQTCPDKRCGKDNGPGKSIWGGNGHPRAMAVGAVNLRSEWIGYSSQGPAALHRQKPDFCSISHFKGYTPCDSGTSAACPVAAGVLALLKQANPNLKQDEARKLLTETAKDIGPPGWDEHSGHGLIQAYEALKRIKGPQSGWYRDD